SSCWCCDEGRDPVRAALRLPRALVRPGRARVVPVPVLLWMVAMTAPRVKLHPDGRAVVLLFHAGEVERPWVAVAAEGGRYLDVEVFTKDEAHAWPDYEAPR